MEVTGTDIQTLQTDVKNSDLTLKEGEQVTVGFVRKLESQMFLLNVNGKNLAAQLSFDPETLGLAGSPSSTSQTNQQSAPANSSGFTAQVFKSPDGGIQLKIFPPLIEFSTNSTGQASPAQTQTGQPKANQPQTAQTSSNQTLSTIQPQSTTQQQTTQNIQTAVQQQPIGTAIIKSPDIRITTQSNTSQSSANQASNASTQISRPDSASAQQAIELTNASQIKQAEAITADGKTIAIRLPAGSLQLTDGEPVQIDILKVQDNGKTLISVNNSLYEVKLTSQVLKSLIAVTQNIPQGIELNILRLPVENLDQSYVKQQVTGLNIDTLLKTFGKFTPTNMSELTAQELKTALKNSGLIFENKLLNGQDISTDEKFKAYMSPDSSAKDSITRMQVSNLMMAGGVFAFLKTQDENVGDTFIKYKKGRKGSDTVYVSTEFSELGETLIIIKPINGTYNITIKTEKDISDQMDNLSLDNGAVRWYKFNKQDLDVINPKTEIASELGSFEVII